MKPFEMGRGITTETNKGKGKAIYDKARLSDFTIIHRIWLIYLQLSMALSVAFISCMSLCIHYLRSITIKPYDRW